MFVKKIEYRNKFLSNLLILIGLFSMGDCCIAGNGQICHGFFLLLEYKYFHLAHLFGIKIVYLS